MPIEIRELNIKAEVPPRELLGRIIKTASSGQAGMNQAIRGVQKLAATEEGMRLLKQLIQQFTIFNPSGTPVRALYSNAWPAKFKGPGFKSDRSAKFNPNEFSIKKKNNWTTAKAAQFVNACLDSLG